MRYCFSRAYLHWKRRTDCRNKLKYNFFDDHDINVGYLIMDGFIDFGIEPTVIMTNLTILEFMEIYSDIEK